MQGPLVSGTKASGVFLTQRHRSLLKDILGHRVIYIFSMALQNVSLLVFITTKGLLESYHHPQATSTKRS